ncbi:hypothetical protein ACFL7D_07390 [candidate division KSB1 bacterium]
MQNTLSGTILNNRSLVFLAVLLFFGFLTYFAGFSVPYYSDDFEVVIDDPSASLFSHLLNSHPGDHFYRPLQAVVLGSIQAAAGLDPIPVHLINLISHVLLCWIIFLIMTYFGFSGIQSALGSLFMLFSQANSHAVLNNDTLSQIFSTLFGIISLFLFTVFLIHRTNQVPVAEKLYLSFSVFFFLLSLLSKESSASYIILISFMSMIITKGDFLQRIKKTTLYLSPYILVVILFAVLRFNIVDTLPAEVSDRYSMQFGFNIIINTVQLFSATIIPFSTVSTYIALVNRDIYELLLVGVTALLLLSTVLLGFFRIKNKNTVNILICLSFLSLTPVLFLSRVSELYAYNAMPFISILFGIGFGFNVEVSKKVLLRKTVIYGIICLLFISNFFAVHSKSGMMLETGNRSTEIILQILRYIEEVPENGDLILINPETDQISYSVYIMPEFTVLDNALSYIKKLSNREDVNIKLIESTEPLEGYYSDNRVVLSINERSVYKIEKY